MIETSAGSTFEAVAAGFDPGLLGTIGVSLEDGDGAIVIARRITGIVESPPASGVYTTTLLAPAIAGTFTVIWDDGTTFAPEQVEVAASAGGGPVPSVDDVAVLMRARTKDTVGAEGTFNANTRPTGNDVQVLIDFIVGEVRGHVGPVLPDILHAQARRATILGVAALIELSFFPEQQNQGGNDRTSAAAYREMYETALANLAAARRSYTASASSGGGQGLGAMRVKTQATLDREAAEAAEATP